MKSLQDYFHEAANRPPAFSEEQLRTIIAEHVSSDDVLDTSGTGFFQRWGKETIVSSVVLIGACAGVVWMLLARSEPLHEQRRLAVVDSSTLVAHAAPAAPAPVPTVTAPSSPVSVAVPPVAAPPKRVETTHRAATPARILPTEPERALAIATPLPIEAESAMRFDAPIDISGTRMIELSDEELAEIGIRIGPDGEAEFGYTNPLNPGRLSTRALIAGNDSGPSIGRTMITQRRWNDRRARLGIVNDVWQLITGDEGQRLTERIEQEDVDPALLDGFLKEYLSPQEQAELARRIDSARGMDRIRREMQFNTLIPIRVRLGVRSARDTQALARSHVIFWCEPDPRLIAALPARVWRQLRAEIARAGNLADRSDTVVQVRKVWSTMMHRLLDSLSIDIDMNGSIAEPIAPGGPLCFGVARTSRGAITSSSVVPNPASTSATLRYTLAEPRTISIALHDIHGQRIRELVRSQGRQAGNTSVDIPLNNVQSGIFLVVITTDRSEQVVQRLIVEKLIAGK